MADSVKSPAVAIAGEHLAKRFGHVRALIDASVTVRPGEVVALFGDNGAGKSTLLKILLGIHRPDAGSLVIDDQQVRPHSITEVQKLGVDCVHQDLALAPDLSVVESMYLGHEVVRKGVAGRFGVVARREAEQQAELRGAPDVLVTVPFFDADIYDMAGLLRLGAQVWD